MTFIEVSYITFIIVNRVGRLEQLGVEIVLLRLPPTLVQGQP